MQFIRHGAMEQMTRRTQMKLINQIQYNKYAMAGNDWPWPKIAGHGRKWLDMAENG